jgi:hypothetical protein
MQFMRDVRPARFNASFTTSGMMGRASSAMDSPPTRDPSPKPPAVDDGSSLPGCATPEFATVIYPSLPLSLSLSLSHSVAPLPAWLTSREGDFSFCLSPFPALKKHYNRAREVGWLRISVGTGAGAKYVLLLLTKRKSLGDGHRRPNRRPLLQIQLWPTPARLIPTPAIRPAGGDERRKREPFYLSTSLMLYAHFLFLLLAYNLCGSARFILKSINFLQ